MADFLIRAFTLAVLIPTAAVALELDLTEDQVAKSYSNVVATDLLVGDSMRVSKFYFCVEDNLFFLLGSATPEERSEYNPEFLIKIEAGSKAALMVSTDHLTDRRKKDVRRSELLPQFYSCDSWVKPVLIPVSTINGHSSLSEYLSSEFFQGYKMLDVD
ncbi:MAG: hypothetical protein NXI27_29375 [Alphaproteobacteria bacterium]|nr:hypothetical protein [Alphaproteobacteria bacterium]